MKGQGIREERETIIRFDEAGDVAEIWTASETVYRRLMRRLGIACVVEDGPRHAVFQCPKALVKLPLLRVAVKKRALHPNFVASRRKPRILPGSVS